MSPGSESRLVVVAGASSQRGDGQQTRNRNQTIFHVHVHFVSPSTVQAQRITRAETL
jgi:diadenosine tetraphosphate (Ap4A) HIT family hydrolase